MKLNKKALTKITICSLIGLLLIFFISQDVSATFPTVEQTNGSESLASNSHNVSMPSIVNSGDLLITMIGGFYNPLNNFTTPTGWSRLGNVSSSGYGSFYVFVKNADGTEGGTKVAFVSDGNAADAVAHVYRISGWINSGTITNDVEIGFGSFANSANPNPPAKNPTNWDVEDTLWIATTFGFPGNDGSGNINGYPVGFSGGFANDTGGGFSNEEVGVAGQQNAPASEAPPQFNRSATYRGWAATIGVRPAAAVQTCTCTNSTAWTISDGSSCTLTTYCNLGANPLRITNGALRITSTGKLDAKSVYVQKGSTFFIDKAGGLICRA